MFLLWMGTKILSRDIWLICWKIGTKIFTALSYNSTAQTILQNNFELYKNKSHQFSLKDYSTRKSHKVFILERVTGTYRTLSLVDLRSLISVYKFTGNRTGFASSPRFTIVSGLSKEL